MLISRDLQWLHADFQVTTFFFLPPFLFRLIGLGSGHPPHGWHSWGGKRRLNPLYNSFHYRHFQGYVTVISSGCEWHRIFGLVLSHSEIKEKGLLIRLRELIKGKQSYESSREFNRRNPLLPGTLLNAKCKISLGLHPNSFRLLSKTLLVLRSVSAECTFFQPF